MVIEIQVIVIEESKWFDKDQTERETIECTFIFYDLIVNDRKVIAIKVANENVMLREN